MVYIQCFRTNDVIDDPGKQIELGKWFMNACGWNAGEITVTITFVSLSETTNKLNGKQIVTTFKVRGSERGGDRIGIDCKEYSYGSGFGGLKDFFVNTLHLKQTIVGKSYFVLESISADNTRFKLYVVDSTVSALALCRSFQQKPVDIISDRSVPEPISDENEKGNEEDKNGGIENQIIYYGAPGTGKSFKIDKILSEGRIPSASIKRVTFYPDYTYSDFVGGIRPEKDGTSIKYVYKGGPFAEALRDAFKGTSYLIIEEINRGNPAAIFGDVFQLLDRDKDGRSKYTITNKELLEFLKKDAEVAAKLTEDKVFIPSGLHILCTMNTADQNVFVLDTAFKRRFRMEYVPIDFSVFDTDKNLSRYKDLTSVFTGVAELSIIEDETDIIGLPENMERNWPTFAQVVNAKIDTINHNEGDLISEDKKLGPFFVTIEEINDRQKFADKVLYYLKQDVFKYCDNVLTDSYETLFDRYVNNNEDIFDIICFSK